MAGPRVSVSYSVCRIYSSEPTKCWLCKTDVPANTLHECRNGVEVGRPHRQVTVAGVLRTPEVGFPPPKRRRARGRP